jgi:hypothetical protein
MTVKKTQTSQRESQRRIAGQSAVSMSRDKQVKLTIQLLITMIGCDNFGHTCKFLQELITTRADKRRLEEQNNKLDQQLKEISVEYSNRLQQYIHDISVSISFVLL